MQPVSTATFVPSNWSVGRRTPAAIAVVVLASTIESSSQGTPSRPSGAVPPSGAARSTSPLAPLVSLSTSASISEVAVPVRTVRIADSVCAASSPTQAMRVRAIGSNVMSVPDSV